MVVEKRKILRIFLWRNLKNFFSEHFYWLNKVIQALEISAKNIRCENSLENLAKIIHLEYPTGKSTMQKHSAQAHWPGIGRVSAKQLSFLIKFWLISFQVEKFIR